MADPQSPLPRQVADVLSRVTEFVLTHLGREQAVSMLNPLHAGGDQVSEG